MKNLIAVASLSMTLSTSALADDWKVSPTLVVNRAEGTVKICGKPITKILLEKGGNIILDFEGSIGNDTISVTLSKHDNTLVQTTAVTGNNKVSFSPEEDGYITISRISGQTSTPIRKLNIIVSKES